jgi:hypothetical protein
MLLEKLVRKPADAPKLHRRDAAFGAGNHAHLLREVMGLANESGSGSRHIVFGVEFNDAGELEFRGITDSTLEEIQGYAELVDRFVEPGLKIEPLYGDVDGNLVAAIEISQCNNPPYVMKMDATRDMRRGDCWVREGGLFRPAQRADLDRMYRESAQQVTGSGANQVVRLGFNGEPTKTSALFDLPDVSRPPSSLEAQRLNSEIKARKEAQSVNVEDTALARLVHTRLYGDAQPYLEQGMSTLVEGYNVVMDKHADADNYYYFETNAVKMNLGIVNTGHEALENVNVLLILPWVEQFQVAQHLYGPPGKPLTVKESELRGYPLVKQYKSAVQVKQKLDFLEPDQILPVWEQELRIAVRAGMAGKKVAIRYSILADSLEHPIEGRLKLVVSKASS